MKKDGSYRFNLKFSCDGEKNIKAGELLEKCGNKKSIVIIEALNEYINNHPELERDKCEIHIIKVPENNGTDNYMEIKKEHMEKQDETDIKDYAKSNSDIDHTDVEDNESEKGVIQMLNNLELFV